jgi:hypothetical protein
MGIRLYCGINETKWNYHPVNPGEFACIAPVYGATSETKKENSVSVQTDTNIIQDSGAFSDSSGNRLCFEGALIRQINHAEKYGYYDKVTHVASYDLLIDEKWIGGRRHKCRWSEIEAEDAVKETINAARYLSNNRSVFENKGLVLSAQGVSPKQYLYCVEKILPYINPEEDILGLGGWCITGKMPRQMMPTFQNTIIQVIPVCARNGIKWIHIWGVMFAPALGKLLWLCNKHGINLSTDSAGPSWRPAFGLWGYADWADKSYEKVDVTIRGLERARHVKAVREWLDNFENTQYYKEPEKFKVQEALL